MSKCYTDIDIDTFKYEWTIKNFSTFLKLPEKDEKYILESSAFTGNNDNDVEWNLNMSFYGDQHENKDYIGLHIKCRNFHDKKNITASQTYYLVNSNNELIKLHETGIKEFSKMEPDWGYQQFDETKRLLGEKHSYFPNDELTIICEVNVFDNVTQHFTNPDELETLEDNLVDIYRKLYVSDNFKDVTFLFGDKEIRAHRAILANRSPALAAMFEPNTKEDKEQIVKIDDIEFEIFEALLRYIYTNELLNIDDIAMKLLAAADKYGLEALVELCGNSLTKNITEKNAAKILIIAERHNAKKLWEFIQQYFHQHESDVIETEGYKMMEEEHPELIVKLLRAGVLQRSKKKAIKMEKFTTTTTKLAHLSS